MIMFRPDGVIIVPETKLGYLNLFNIFFVGISN